MLYPIEIKKSASSGKDVIKNFGVLKPVTEPERFGERSQTKMKIGNGTVVCMANDLLLIDAKNWYVPAWMI